jgi:hypothetical protein
MQISSYERLASSVMRMKKARDIYDKFIYVEQLVMNTEVGAWVGLRNLELISNGFASLCWRRG